MIAFIIVDKTGQIKEQTSKNLAEEDIYKKCGFKKKDNFEKRTIWNVKLENIEYNIELYAKDDGRANTENKYDFPPPVDSDLYFGNCCLVNKDSEDNFCNLSCDIWKKIYEKLFGGFEDLEDEEFSEDELDNIPDECKTKLGYLKDGFVVDDSDEIVCNEDEGNDVNDDDSDNTDLDSELSEDEYQY